MSNAVGPAPSESARPERLPREARECAVQQHARLLQSDPSSSTTFESISKRDLSERTVPKNPQYEKFGYAGGLSR